MAVNKFIGVGNVGKQPEIRQMDSGLSVANFSIAITEKYKNKKGEPSEVTEWINVVAFGKLAEIVQKYIPKGARVYVEGKLKTETYEKNGVKMYSTKIVASEVMSLTPRAEATASKHYEDKANGYQRQDEEEFDDVIPF